MYILLAIETSDPSQLFERNYFSRTQVQYDVGLASYSDVVILLTHVRLSFFSTGLYDSFVRLR